MSSAQHLEGSTSQSSSPWLKAGKSDLNLDAQFQLFHHAVKIATFPADSFVDFILKISFLILKGQQRVLMSAFRRLQISTLTDVTVQMNAFIAG